ncbi:hypothetical protein CKA32_004412 [Geitlerinema sp. FC II]|nr:hypothetical protein [Geitlerinema sp. CS-897]PPT11377.1 hypothetical protein CKA32_004412 [Geitlerinema sp. FC II]
MLSNLTIFRDVTNKPMKILLVTLITLVLAGLWVMLMAMPTAMG